MKRIYTINILKKYEHLLEDLEINKNLIINHIDVDDAIEQFANDKGVIPTEAIPSNSRKLSCLFPLGKDDDGNLKSLAKSNEVKISHNGKCSVTKLVESTFSSKKRGRPPKVVEPPLPPEPVLTL